jgi:hypothetical protein
VGEIHHSTFGVLEATQHKLEAGLVVDRVRESYDQGPISVLQQVTDLAEETIWVRNMFEDMRAEHDIVGRREVSGQTALPPALPPS